MMTKETILKYTGKEKTKTDICEQMGIINNSIFHKKMRAMLHIIMVVNCYIGFLML